MNTLNDALQSIDSYLSEQVYCEIDKDTRIISVPDKYKILGVESDEDVERVHFKCPKIVGDDIDLSQLYIFINFQNASGEKDRYYVEDKSVETDYITFSWLISRKVVKTKGKVKFIVCAKKSVEDDVTNEWNTTVATSDVLEGLEPEESFTEDEKDIITQLIEKVNRLIEAGGAGAPSFYIREDGHLIARYEE